MKNACKHISAFIPILLALNLLLNVVLLVIVMNPNESKTFLDGRYATDLSRGSGDREYYFDITFYKNGTAYVEQHYPVHNITYETTCTYSYSSESNIAVLSFDKNGYNYTYSFEVSRNKKELFDSGFTLVRNFERGPESTSTSTVPTESMVVTEPEVVEEIGKIYIAEATGGFASQGFKEFVKIPTESGYFAIYLPDSVTNILLSDNKITFSILTDWMQINYTYEIATDITSAPEAELKIKSITDTLPASLGSNYSAIHIMQDFKDYLNYGIDLCDVWFDDFSSTGAAYFYESCNYTSSNDVVFSKMITESYNCVNGVTVHEAVEVVHFNFIDYYNSFETRIEKENAKKEFSAALNTCMIEMTFRQGESPHDCVNAMRGFDFCLSEKTKVLPSS